MTRSGFLAPELFLEAAPFTIASDLWAIGCVLHLMTTGKMPFLRSAEGKMLTTAVRQPKGQLLTNLLPNTQAEFHLSKVEFDERRKVKLVG